MLFFLFSFLWALPDAYHTKYLERIHTNNTSVVLVLISPGWTEKMLDPLLYHIWKEGFSVWSLRFAEHAQSDQEMKHSIEQAIDKHQSPIVIAQGFSGRTLLQHSKRFASKISALALFASPVRISCSPVLEQALKGGSWSILENPPLKNANPSFHNDVWEACQRRDTFALPFQHVWATTTNGNAIVPPESIRPYLLEHHFFLRAGPLSLQGAEPSYQELFTHPPTLSALSKWMRKIQ